MVYAIEEIKEKIIPIAQEYGVERVSLFGSYARGEANEDSDVDFYIEKGQIRNLIDYIGFVNDLEDNLNCHVDVITTGIEDKSFLELIKKEGVLLYENG